MQKYRSATQQERSALWSKLNETERQFLTALHRRFETRLIVPEKPQEKTP